MFKTFVYLPPGGAPKVIQPNFPTENELLQVNVNVIHRSFNMLQTNEAISCQNTCVFE